MPQQDHYAILGVLPNAEDVVIAAAYRALAQRYHPDRWGGKPEDAHRRMSEINTAYSTLRDKDSREAYDASRRNKPYQDFSSDFDRDYQEAFNSALNEVEDNWALACSIYPDLKVLRSNLGRISTSLAFAFVTCLLGLKVYDKRAELAAHLELDFLQRYFGTDPLVVSYAKEVISVGARGAALALNRLVDVMGSGVDARILIDKIEREFKVLDRVSLDSFERDLLSAGYKYGKIKKTDCVIFSGGQAAYRIYDSIFRLFDNIENMNKSLSHFRWGGVHLATGYMRDITIKSLQ